MLAGDLTLIHQPITQLFIDSRTAFAMDGGVFFAIKTTKANGNQFIDDAYQKGIRLFIVESSPKNIIEGCLYLSVSSCLNALQHISRLHREAFTLPVIGITGSNGKTIVKEWLAQMLSAERAVARSPKSYNSQIGVSLSVWQLQPYHQVALFEAGISQPGEMEQLEAMIQPTIGLFTRLGIAHESGFTSRQQKLAEKWKLFDNCTMVILSSNQADVVAYAAENLRTHQQLAIWSVTDTMANPATGNLSVNHLLFDEHIAIELPFSDPASVENVLHAVAALRILGFQKEFIQTGLDALTPVNMRLEWKEAMNGSRLCDDTWTNDLDGLLSAFQYFKGQVRSGFRRQLIVTDMFTGGVPAAEAYAKAGHLSHRAGIDQSYLIGPSIAPYAHIFPNATAYATTSELLDALPTLDFANSDVLIKGMRSFQLERVVQRLESLNHGTRLEISLDAITQNYNYYRALLSPGVKIMSMVKASAYGAGSYQVARLLEYMRVDYLTVAYHDEGVELRRQGILVPIMVMSCEPEHYEIATRHNLEPVIYSISRLVAFEHHCRNAGMPSSIHLEFDTGMNRLGFNADEADEVGNRVKSSPFVLCRSVFSHLSAAEDEAHDEFTHQQALLFEQICNNLSQLGLPPFIKHLVNTAGVQRFPQYHYDMVRLGIGLYGIEVTGQRGNPLGTVSRLKARIMQIHIAKTGETVGYGHKDALAADTCIATISLGYADGFSRSFGNGAISVRVGGQMAPTIGNVCMDMSMIDITGIEAREGDEVVIFDETLPVERLAKADGTIAYEILTRISSRIKRVFLSE